MVPSRYHPFSQSLILKQVREAVSSNPILNKLRVHIAIEFSLMLLRKDSDWFEILDFVEEETFCDEGRAAEVLSRNISLPKRA